MKKEIQRLIFLVGLVAMSASCSKTSFTNVAPDAISKAEVPADNPIDQPDVVAPPTYNAKVTSGLCKGDSSTQVLSCLSCDVPVNPPAPPQLSAKAQALVDAMFLACQIPNLSDRNNFRPTKEMLVKKLNRGSTVLYPETPRNSQMAMVIEGLTNPTDNSLRKRMFGKLWYSGTYSDAFETYFGLTVQEAKSTLCWDGDVDTPNITGYSGLYSKQYMDCVNEGRPNCRIPPDYVAADVYRNQLENVLNTSIRNPYVAPTPLPAKTCSWEKFEGDDIQKAKEQFKAWKAEGRKLSMEIRKGNGVSMCGDASDASFVTGVTVSIASYSCK